MNTTKGKTMKRLLSALAASLTLFAVSERAEAQEIQLTGPLAGAPAVRKLRLHREARFEIAPAVSFSLLDEYQRTILIGGRINYNLTDWLAIGVWGGFGAVKIPTALTDHIQDVNVQRRNAAAMNMENYEETITGRLTNVNLGSDFKKQIRQIDWVAAPQITAVPFRGKLALFQSIYVDTDVYLSAGPAFVGLSERKECNAQDAAAANTNCGNAAYFARASRVAIAPTFALGLTFYVNKWSALGFEWRFLPFSSNAGGFDTAGTGKDNAFPDNSISADDRNFKFNQFLTVSYSFYLPTQYRVSE